MKVIIIRKQVPVKSHIFTGTRPIESGVRLRDQEIKGQKLVGAEICLRAKSSSIPSHRTTSRWSYKRRHPTEPDDDPHRRRQTTSVLIDIMTGQTRLLTCKLISSSLSQYVATTAPSTPALTTNLNDFYRNICKPIRILNQLPLLHQISNSSTPLFTRDLAICNADRALCGRRNIAGRFCTQELLKGSWRFSTICERILLRLLTDSWEQRAWCSSRTCTQPLFSYSPSSCRLRSRDREEILPWLETRKVSTFFLIRNSMIERGLEFSEHFSINGEMGAPRC